MRVGAGYGQDHIFRNVEMYEGDPGLASQVVINTEWGALGNTGSLDFMRTRWDHRLDQASKNSGKQVYEKLISGMYLGELFRQVSPPCPSSLPLGGAGGCGEVSPVPRCGRICRVWAKGLSAHPPHIRD